MKRFLVIALLLFYSSTPLLAQDKKAPYRFMFSPHLSPWMGAEDINSVQRLLMAGENYLLSDVPGYFTEAEIQLSTLRLAELTFIWTPIAYLEMVYQHEYFGHGAMIRMLNKDHIASVDGYSYFTPPPYGSGGAATRFYVNQQLISNYILANIAAGGVNATGILGMNLQEKWIQSEAIDGRDSLLYLRAYQNITDYVYDVRFTSTESKTQHSGHDMEDYLLYLKQIYNQDFTKSKLRSYTAVTLIDPFTYYAIWSVANYIWDGSPIETPMIPISDYQYLPSFRLMLAPYGPEVMMINYIKTPSKKWMSVNLRACKGFVPTSSYGIGLQFPKFIKKDTWALGGKIDLWRQPKMSLIKDDDFNPKQQKVGGALQIEGSFRVYKNTSLYGLVGYKTKGYLPGEALDHRTLVQLGFEFEL